MSLTGWMICLGGTLQLAGLVVTGDGARRTWNEFMPGEPLLRPVVVWVRKQLWPVIRAFRWLLRRKPKSVVVSAGGPMIATSTVGEARSRTGYPPLSPELAVADAVAELDERMRTIAKWQQEDWQNLQASQGALTARVSAVEHNLFKTTLELRQESRKIAVGGLKEILLGLSVSGAGVAIQTSFSIPTV